MGDQGLRIDQPKLRLQLSPNWRQAIARPGAEPCSYHHIDTVCAEPGGKQAGNMLRRGNNSLPRIFRCSRSASTNRNCSECPKCCDNRPSDSGIAIRIFSHSSMKPIVTRSELNLPPAIRARSAVHGVDGHSRALLSFDGAVARASSPRRKLSSRSGTGTSAPAIQPRMFAACKCRSAPAPIPLNTTSVQPLAASMSTTARPFNPVFWTKVETPPSWSAIITHFAFPKCGESFESSRLSNVINAILLIVNVLRANRRPSAWRMVHRRHAGCCPLDSLLYLCNIPLDV